LILPAFSFAQNSNPLVKAKFRLELPAPKDRILYAAFSPDGEKILLGWSPDGALLMTVAKDNNAVTLWEIAPK
jgi:hypothetical protein